MSLPPPKPGLPPWPLKWNLADNATLPEDDAHALALQEEPKTTLTLVLIWCQDEPDRAGEVLVLPPDEQGPFVMGRGEARPEDPHPRLSLIRQRPGPLREAVAPLSSPRISRVQLALCLRDSGESLEVTQLGLCPLLHDGVTVTSARVVEGDVIQLGNQLMFLCARRPSALKAPSTDPSYHPFGEADGDGVVGESPAVWRLRDQIAFVGPREGHVLVLGASGTGKELIANAVHSRSARRSRRLIARNAATIPEGIIDAELFGNAKNYPNPGMADRPGLIGSADGSTLFLDEFAELPLTLQAHLLRVLDAGEYQRLGESVVRHANFRLVAATNRPPLEIKHDVLARLKFVLGLPDLNSRREDVPLLVRHLLRRIAAAEPDVAARIFPSGSLDEAPRIGSSLIRKLVQHRYTTNVRELDSLLWKALAGGGLLDLSEEPSTPRIFSASAPPSGTAATIPPGLAIPSAGQALLDTDGPQLSPREIQDCLDKNNGVLDKTWRALGLRNRHVLARLIAKHGLMVRRQGGRRDDP